MSEILHLLMMIVSGDVPPLGTLALFLAAFAIYKIGGKYLEELWFRIFPMDNFRAKISRLEKELKAERAEKDETHRLAERILARLGRTESALMNTRREAAVLREALRKLKARSRPAAGGKRRARGARTETRRRTDPRQHTG